MQPSLSMSRSKGPAVVAGSDGTTHQVQNLMEDSKRLWLDIHRKIPRRDIRLGPAVANAYVADPKLLGFIAARYKFVAKMLEGSPTVLEVGCGDAFGAPIVAQSVGRLICTDIDDATLTDN